MANLFQFILLKKSIKDWNLWREEHVDIPIDLSYADFSNDSLNDANLAYANLNYATLSYTNLEDANLIAADLSFATLNHAKLGNANLKNANLNTANLDCARLYNADFTEVNLTHATREEYPFLAQFYVMPEWASVVVNTGKGNRFFTHATLASIAQGVDIIERQWNEQKEMRQQNNSPTASSSNPPSAGSEIIEIVLLMDDNRTLCSFKPQTSDFEFLKASLNSIGNIKPLYVIFQRHEGPSLIMNVSEDGKVHPPLNLILSYLKADLQ